MPLMPGGKTSSCARWCGSPLPMLWVTASVSGPGTATPPVLSPSSGTHRQNRIDLRLSAWCDELTRSGELFIALFTNPADGMSYVRAVPARHIVRVETDPQDYEKETGYIEQQNSSLPPGEGSACPHAPPGEGEGEPPTRPTPLVGLHPAGPGRIQVPVLLHYTINKPVGATRGESDLTPILPWALRYTQWLKDRVRHNQLRTELAAA